MRGKVRKWDDSRGFGFITEGNGAGRDFFCHYTQILGDGFKTLSVGQEVEFTPYETDLGFEAKDITKL